MNVPMIPCSPSPLLAPLKNPLLLPSMPSTAGATTQLRSALASPRSPLGSSQVGHYPLCPARCSEASGAFRHARCYPTQAVAYISDIQSGSVFPQFSLLWWQKYAKPLNLITRALMCFKQWSPVIAAPHRVMAEGPDSVIGVGRGRGCVQG